MPVFPWSMSDFKPGDYNETLSNVLAMGLLCHSYAQKLSGRPG
ncbi:MAG: hypothetical protein Q4A46_01850 [Clostridia bacterium]|nr:hypothetical protein [Clostridia bacterium]